MGGKGNRGKGGGGSSHDRAIKTGKEHANKAPETEVVSPRQSNNGQVVTTPLSKRPRVLDYAIIRMGVPLGIAAIGVGLMTANHFLSGIILLYLGLGLFALDI